MSGVYFFMSACRVLQATEKASRKMSNIASKCPIQRMNFEYRKSQAKVEWQKPRSNAGCFVSECPVSWVNVMIKCRKWMSNVSSKYRMSSVNYRKRMPNVASESLISPANADCHERMPGVVSEYPMLWAIVANECWMLWANAECRKYCNQMSYLKCRKRISNVVNDCTMSQTSPESRLQLPNNASECWMSV